MKISIAPQILIIKPEGPIIYVNAEDFRNKLFGIMNKYKDAKSIIIDMAAVYYKMLPALIL